MNIFKSDIAPIFLGAALAVIGYFIDDLVGEFRSGVTATYRISYQSEGKVTVSIQNVSRTAIIEKAVFEIVCSDQRLTCLSEFDGEMGVMPMSA